jgi:hypothetical protein
MTTSAVDPSVLYYTCSTIAQALASAFGVLAAFALFRFSALQRDIAAAKAELETVADDKRDAAWRELRDRGYEKLAEFLVKENLRRIGSGGTMRLTLEEGRKAWQSWTSLYTWLARSAIATALGIGVASWPCRSPRNSPTAGGGPARHWRPPSRFR